MQTGLHGLAVWSFLMATAHGAGLMLWSAIMPTCLESGGGTFQPLATTVLTSAGIHTLAMAATTVIVAGLVYEWLGVGVLRQAWFDVDAVWIGALCFTGILLLLSG